MAGLAVAADDPAGTAEAGAPAFEVLLIQPGDRTIFRPGEEIELQARIQGLPGRASRPYTVRIEGGEPLSTGEVAPGSDPIVIPIRIQAPLQEGAAAVLFEIEGIKRPQATAAFDLLVLDAGHRKSSGASSQVAEPRMIEEIRCDATPDAERYLDSGDATVRESPLGRFRHTGTRSKNVYPPTNKPKNITRDNISWFAYRLDVQNPRRPHLLEIDYPDDALRSMGINIYQPGPDQQIRGLQVGSGVLTGGDYPNSNSVRTHRIYFWPPEKSIAVLVANRLPGQDAAISALRLYELPDGLPPLELADTLPTRRQMGLFFEEPKIPEGFGGLRTGSPPRRGWDFYYRSAENLIEYMRYCGFNSVHSLMSGYGDTLYPSALLCQGRRYVDTPAGAPRKDILEMFLTLFDREGFQFIPELVFQNFKEGNAWFEASMKEAKIRPEDYLTVDRLGNIGPEVAQNKRNAGGDLQRMGRMRYEPLSPHWQEVVLASLREIATRYKDHPSFGGVQVRINVNTDLYYRSLDFGYGDNVITLFEADTGIEVPGDPGDPDRFAKRHEFLTGPKREPFLTWRCQKIADFIRRMAGEIQAVRSDLKLYLGIFPNGLTPDLRHPDSGAQVSAEGFSLPEFRREMGINPGLWKGIDNLEIMRQRRDGGHFLYQATELNRPNQYQKEWDISQENVDWMRQAGAPMGAVSFFTYFESRLDDFALKMEGNWFPQTQVWMVGTHVPTPPFALEPFAHALNRFDPPFLLWGGFHAPMGYEEQLRDFARAYLPLPRVPFQKSPTSVQPVGIHTANAEGKGWAYIVNESYAPAKVRLTLSAPEARSLSVLPVEKQVSIENGVVSLDLSVEAYSVVTLVTDAGNLSVTDASVEPGSFYTSNLEKRTAELLSLLSKSSAPDSADLSSSLQTLLEQKRWVELWETIHSAKVFDAITRDLPAGKTQAESYFDL